MANIQRLRENLERNRFATSFFETKEEARDYLAREIQQCTVGIGDSETLMAMGLNEALKACNPVVEDCQYPAEGVSFKENAKLTLLKDVFISSLNAIAETGELVNIDGTGNRVAGTLFGSNRVYFVIGVNKIAPTLEAAITRAREVAAPKNGYRKQYGTPCAHTSQCHDCHAPDRICNALVIMYQKMRNVEHMEVVIVNEELGF